MQYLQIYIFQTTSNNIQIPVYLKRAQETDYIQIVSAL